MPGSRAARASVAKSGDGPIEAAIGSQDSGGAIVFLSPIRDGPIEARVRRRIGPHGAVSVAKSGDGPIEASGWNRDSSLSRAAVSFFRRQSGTAPLKLVADGFEVWRDRGVSVANQGRPH